jgi:hypothetical protein
MNIYRKEGTYLVREKNTNEFVRWQGDNKIFFAGSKEDALIGLSEDEFEALRVCDCPDDIQEEYEKRIIECIHSGEIDIQDILPKEVKVGIYYYIDDEGKPQFDTDEMRSEFEAYITELEKLS